MPAHVGPGDPLERLKRRDDVLEICFWYRGEGFGDVFSARALTPFLAAGEAVVEAALRELAAEGQMRLLGRGYVFTEAGRRKAGRMFAESFVDFQRPAHGECEGDCCGEDEQDACSEHQHAHGPREP
ncbi:MAG TPA: hypothetical protein VFZ01_12110 [Geminicoccaceae bacterium]